ncbi:MAG TPA: ACT domain-containing protein [Candidatus Obscuribacterales bacterium]
MRFTLEIRMSNTEGALERILGRLRQRSFSVCSMMADSGQDRSFMNARITVESARPVEPALKQLAKLFDVHEVKVHHAEADSNNGYRANQATSQGEFCLSV